ncbi:hypothetical protein K2X05_13745 [bacterium]|nr:hypothetical protein [bacterium]
MQLRLSLLLLFLISRPQAAVAGELESLRWQTCHTQLTDLQEKIRQSEIQKTESLNPRAEIESLFALRMELKHKINSWVQLDPDLSVECIQLSYQIQNQWRKQEEQKAARLYRVGKDWPMVQRVFMYSQEQLFSNPLLSKDIPITSLTDLKNGDIVWADENVSVVYKNENGEFYSLVPDHQTHWVKLSMQHPLGWIKKPSQRVVVLRHWNEKVADSAVRTILQKVSGNNALEIENRGPASTWVSLVPWYNGKIFVEPEADPNFLQVFEWKNYQALGLTSH